MDLNIRRSVINNIKDSEEGDIIKMVDESVNRSDEILLPGMGVLLEIIWKNSDNERKNMLANVIKQGL